MINTNKLLPTTSGKSQSLIENLTVIKKDVIKINSLLKERLVLSKVRYAILKQNEERKKRQDRESLLEIRKETRSQSVTPSKKKKKRGLLSNLLGGIFKIFTRGWEYKVGAAKKWLKVAKFLIERVVIYGFSWIFWPYR